MKQMIGSFVLVYGVIVVLMKHMFFIRAYHDILIHRHQEQANAVSIALFHCTIKDDYYASSGVNPMAI